MGKAFRPKVTMIKIMEKIEENTQYLGRNYSLWRCGDFPCLFWMVLGKTIFPEFTTGKLKNGNKKFSESCNSMSMQKRILIK